MNRAEFRRIIADIGALRNTSQSGRELEELAQRLGRRVEVESQGGFERIWTSSFSGLTRVHIPHAQARVERLLVNRILGIFEGEDVPAWDEHLLNVEIRERLRERGDSDDRFV